ncbi:nucleotidyl transferase AbiEii/AbiGii toxin family protein [Acetobacterium sp.]|uniref:nucleotidyl transferase AbiEii/AbiGii toxin family protein n=1 Tax=Acetobacterium sp. TaxID=1872094 RepID=UPI003593CA6F
MFNIARESLENRKELFVNTAIKKRMSESIIEKDFWVCFLLELIFYHCEYAQYFSFKGGTSLSKGYQVIERFSEDIDLILDWCALSYQQNEPWIERSNSKQDQFNKEMNKNTEVFLKQNLLPVLEEIMGKYVKDSFEFYINDNDLQTIRFIYPQIFKDQSILQEIRLEIGALAAWTPVTEKIITSYVAEEYPHIFAKRNSKIRMVEAKRTFWEKATILHREGNRTNGSIPERYSRHYYDLYLLSKADVKDEALNDLRLLNKVVEFKMRFYRSNWAKYEEATNGKLKLLPQENHLFELEKDYEKMQNMIFGEKVAFKKIMTGLTELEQLINTRF